MPRGRGGNPDRLFLFFALALVVSGFIVFTSAAFGLMAREGASFSSVLFSQTVLGLIGGGVVGYLLYRVDLTLVRKYSFPLIIAALLLTLAVFIPGIGFEWAGAKRWILLGPVSFQPSELLKLATIIFTASWMAAMGKGITTLKYGVGPLLGTMAVVGAVLLAQPDNGTFLVLFATLAVLFLVAGGRLLHIAGLGLLALLIFGSIVMARPYVMDRITTFLNPTEDILGSSYQIRQALVAIGSGRWFGRGFGQSIQKFEYLPEPIGDSIFAVLGEEFGFFGASTMVILFMALALRGLKIAARAPNMFARLTVAGIIASITAQSFLNIGAMLGVLPLTGIPLVFVSHGGSALLVAMASIGLILNISRFQKVT